MTYELLLSVLDAVVFEQVTVSNMIAFFLFLDLCVVVGPSLARYITRVARRFRRFS